MRASVGGVELEYQVEGQGPWLILSHSLTTDLGMWDLQMPPLLKQFRVLRYDMRGHGRSAAPAGPYSFDELGGDVLGLMDALGIDRASYVGLSIGGMIGQHLALRAPERFERLVLANTTSRIPPEGVALWEERIRAVGERGLEPLVQSTLERWFTEPYRQANSDVMAWIGAMIRRTPAAGYIGCGRAIQTLDLTDRLGAIRLPVLVIAGAEDPGTPPAAGAGIAQAIPGARLEIIARASHLSCIEQPETFNRLLLDFLTPPDQADFSARK